MKGNLNQIPALLVVAQRPRELTRAQLRELRIQLAAAGFGEMALRNAWCDATNEDIAASIVGHVRQAALGDALLPYQERVERAVQRILKSRPWTKPQRDWLEKIGKQIALMTVVDRGAFEEEGIFKLAGGYARFDKMFDGKLAEVLAELGEGIWRCAG